MHGDAVDAEEMWHLNLFEEDRKLAAGNSGKGRVKMHCALWWRDHELATATEGLQRSMGAQQAR